MTSYPDPPKQIRGREHLSEGRCKCGCQWTVDCVGTLRENEDTPKLQGLNIAIYDIPADRASRRGLGLLDDHFDNRRDGGRPWLTTPQSSGPTDTTWNPVTGCDRVSPGCAHCYALDLAARLKAMGQPKYQRDGDPKTSGPGFGVTLHPSELDRPLRWRKPRRVFVNSMSDPCEQHHRRFDGHLTPSLKVPAASLPAHVIEFAEQWGLEHEIERKFGAYRDEVAA